MNFYTSAQVLFKCIEGPWGLTLYLSAAYHSGKVNSDTTCCGNFRSNKGSRHSTALIPNKFTRCAYNIQKHSLRIDSSTLPGVMIPVGVSMFNLYTIPHK